MPMTIPKHHYPLVRNMSSVKGSRPPAASLKIRFPSADQRASLILHPELIIPSAKPARRVHLVLASGTDLHIPDPYYARSVADYKAIRPFVEQ